MTHFFETTKLRSLFSTIYIFHSVLTDHGKCRSNATFQELSGHFEKCKSIEAKSLRLIFQFITANITLVRNSTITTKTTKHILRFATKHCCLPIMHHFSAFLTAISTPKVNQTNQTNYYRKNNNIFSTGKQYGTFNTQEDSNNKKRQTHL